MSIYGLPPKLQRHLHLNDRTQCWEWDNVTRPDGYGRVWWNGRTQLAHRAVFEASFGAVPPGLELDHLCRVRHCCNPEHLEPVTHQINTLRGLGVTATNARKERCPKNHPYIAETIAKSGARQVRQCKVCLRDRSRVVRRLERAGLRPVGRCPGCKVQERAPGRSYCSPCHVKANARARAKQRMR